MAEGHAPIEADETCQTDRVVEPAAGELDAVAPTPEFLGKHARGPTQPCGDVQNRAPSLEADGHRERPIRRGAAGVVLIGHPTVRGFGEIARADTVERAAASPHPFEHGVRRQRVLGIDLFEPGADRRVHGHSGVVVGKDKTALEFSGEGVGVGRERVQLMKTRDLSRVLGELRSGEEIAAR
jgi:hypothetical protein